MAYGRNKNQFAIKEGNLLIGVFTPSAITTTNPFNGSAWTLTADLGYFQQGSLAPELTRKYAEFLSGTPAIKVRKDLIQKEWMGSATFAQFNANLLALAQGLDVESGVYTIGWVGHDEVTAASTRYGFRLSTLLVDGRAFDLCWFAGQVTAEQVAPSFPGTAHSTFPIKIEGFPYSESATASRDLGMITILEATSS